MEPETRRVLERLEKHADHGPALFTISREDAKRILAVLHTPPPEPGIDTLTEGQGRDEFA